MVNSDTNEKNILEKEYEEKYLGKFVEVKILDRFGENTCTDYFKVDKVNVNLEYIEVDEGNFVQVKIDLLCQNRIRDFISIDRKRRIRIETVYDEGCSYLKDNIDRFVKIIDKQTFKNILKTEVNNIIHTL